MKNKMIRILGFVVIVLLVSCKTDSGDDSSPTTSKAPDVKKITYSVNHYQQNIDDDEYILFESDELEGIEGEYTNAAAKSYEHFTPKDFLQKEIKKDGNNTVSIYYDRDIINLYFDPNGGSWSDCTSEIKLLTDRYGASVIFNELPQKVGYGTIWDKEIQETFSFDETYTAVYEAGMSNYKIEHFLQNIEDDSYPEEAFETEIEIGSIDTLTQAEAKEYEGFISPHITQQIISYDGTTVIRIEYERKKYTVTFDSNGGDVIEDQIIKFGAKASLPSLSLKTGYDFIGWYTSNDGGTTLDSTAYDFNSEIYSDLDLFAKWEVKTISYTVKHFLQNIEDDNYVEKESETLSGKFAEQTMATAKVYAGFTPLAISQIRITENTPTVKVFYNRNVYTVTFDTKDGTDSSSKKIRYGGKVSKPTIPERYHYDFIDWYTSNDGGTTLNSTAFDFNTEINSNLDLFAKWEAKTYSYTVKHFLQNIEDDNYVENEIETLSGKFSEETEVTAKSYTGFTPLAITQKTISENTPTVEVFYNRNIYTVSFNSKGGSDVSSQRIKHGGKVTTPAAPERYPYDFVDWYTSNNAGSTLAEEAFDFNNVPVSDDITLYAKWFLDLSNCNADNVVSKIQEAFYGGTVVLKGAITSQTLTELKNAIDNCRSYIYLDLSATSGLEKIPNSAFYECKKIRGITLPAGTKSIDSYAFYKCSGLETVILPEGLNTIGYRAFQECTYLSNVAIPSSVTTIKDDAFWMCKCLNNITIPETVTSLGAYVFGFSGVKEITIPGSINVVTIYTFTGCANLTTVTIENGVTIIGQSVFDGCNALSSVTLPASITTIRTDAFAFCKSLTNITFNGTKEQWDAIEKGDNWNKKSSVTNVICTDGEFAL